MKSTLKHILVSFGIVSFLAISGHSIHGFNAKPISVNGLTLGMTEEEANNILAYELKFRKTTITGDGQPADAVLWETKSDSDRGKTYFVRLICSKGIVVSLTGRMKNLEVGAEHLEINSSLSFTNLHLGSPDWEKSAGDGDLGVYYKADKLYLVFCEGKLDGFSLGEIP